MKAETNEDIELVRTLAQAVSEQAQVANRTWIALVSVSVYGSLPHRSDVVALPFGLGDASREWFYVVICLLLAVLSVAYAAAQAQQSRAHRLAQFQLSSRGNALISGTHLHPRDLFDSLRVPSLSRVAPLPQLLQGRKAFYSTGMSVSRVRRRLATLYYYSLKLLTWLVFYVAPGAALWGAFGKAEVDGWQSCVLATFAVVASLALLQVLADDVVYVQGVPEAMAAPPLSKKRGR